MKLPVMEHSHARAALPQWYADQFGWEEIVDETAKAYNQLRPAERPGCGLIAKGIILAWRLPTFWDGGTDCLRRPRGHQTYWIWGPRGYSGNCLVVLDDSRERLEELFEHVEYVGTSADSPYALERQIPVYVCRGAKFGTLEKLWPQLKKWR